MLGKVWFEFGSHRFILEKLIMVHNLYIAIGFVCLISLQISCNQFICIIFILGVRRPFRRCPDHQGPEGAPQGQEEGEEHQAQR